jgi:arylsulfatase A-like enzyme
MSEKAKERSVSRRMSVVPAAVCIVLSGVLITAGCKQAHPPENFILITLDAQRADYLSSYGAANVKTPNLDGLARQGILFENCFSLIPITAPAHAAIFYSQPPHALNLYNNGQEFRKSRLRQDKLPLASLFKKRGYATAAFISLGVLHSKFALNGGFDVYSDEFPADRWYLTAEEINARVFPWLEAHKGEKFFLWIHYSDPHDPYAPPNSPPDLKIYQDDRLLGAYCLNKYSLNTVPIQIPSGKSRIRFDVYNTETESQYPYPGRLTEYHFKPLPGGKTITTEFSSDWYLRYDDNNFFYKNGAAIDIVNRGRPTSGELAFRGRLNLKTAGGRIRYGAEVEYMDGEIGRLIDTLKALRLFDKTGILAVGDHGEGMGERTTSAGLPHFGHIHYLYNGYLKVPLILYSPSLPERGARRSPTATLLDVAPTIAHLMRFKNLPAYQGRNLLRLEEEKDFTVFEETYRPEAFKDLFGIRRGSWHLILSPEGRRYELFDLSRDFAEQANVFEDNKESREIAGLKQTIDEFARNILKSKGNINFDSETERMLRSLGYIR